MSDYRVEAYKKAVRSITQKWGKEISKVNAELRKVDEQLADMEDIEDPSDDDKKEVADLKKRQLALRKKIDNCAMNLQVNLRLIEPQPGAPKKELLELPGWLKSIIENEGIPLGGGVSVAPDIDVDIKAKSLEKFGATITIKW